VDIRNADVICNAKAEDEVLRFAGTPQSGRPGIRQSRLQSSAVRCTSTSLRCGWMDDVVVLALQMQTGSRLRRRRPAGDNVNAVSTAFSQRQFTPLCHGRRDN
jgi:hypothetical protein